MQPDNAMLFTPGATEDFAHGSGGRPDLAESVLDRVQAPTLFIVGGEDRDVLALNQRALRTLAGEKLLRVVPGATHLFEEPGALEQVIEHAGDWFETHLPRARQ